MKKICLSIFILTFAHSLSYAQNSNPWPTTGNVAIGTSSATHSLTLGSTATGIAQYNTVDQITNYERVVKSWQGNVFGIGSFAGGTGTARSMTLGIQTANGTNTLVNGRLFSINLNAGVPAGIYDFNLGATGGVGSMVTLNSLFQQAASGQQTALAIQPTISQAGTSSYMGLLMSVFENTTGSGTKTLMDLGTNTAAAGGGTHTSKFSVANTGAGYFAGNVSIGTATHPTGYMLAVNGSAIATAMWVKLYANWPDYVFKTNYHLPALSEVKTYIAANHHLPDVPTEREVKQNGLNLGEMNRVLVKKVEELTLYMIEKDNQLSQQSQQIRKQEIEQQNQEKRILALEEALLKLSKSNTNSQQK